MKRNLTAAKRDLSAEPLSGSDGAGGTSDTWMRMVAWLAGSDAPAVFTDDGSWTGRQLMRHAGGAADFLDAVRAPPGEPIVTLATSNPTSYALAIAAAATDRALAPLGPRLTPAELIPCISALSGDVLLTEPEFEELARAVVRETGRRMVVIEPVAESDRVLPTDVGADRPAVILHTSGTTGRPKPVSYVQGRLAARTRVNRELVMLGPGAVFATASPFHHIAGVGMLFVALAAGAAPLSVSRFDVATWRKLGERGVTHALVVPTMVEMLLDADALALPSLRVLQYGASPIHPDTLARALESLPDVRFVNLFGQTEGSPITCLSPADHVRASQGRADLLASVGRAAPGVEMRIATPDEHGIGEVWARAEHLFQPDEDGWLRTGDLGRIDDHGYLFLSGRKGDKIIRGGENVYPIEVEQVLALHPAIADICVYGVADRRWGEIVAAAVVPAPGEAIPDSDELRVFARERLAGFKVPTVWREVDELPRNATGKVLRRQLVATHP